MFIFVRLKFLEMIKKIKTIFFSIALFSVSLIFVSSAAPDNFKIVKNLDLFFAAFRELNLLYVDEINPDEVIKSGIEGMLSDLDPYTDYLPEEDMDEFDLLTTGEYSGIGALVGKKGDYIQISETYRGFPADKAGLVSGDIVLEIDGVSLKDKSTTDASNLLKGEQSTTLEMRVVKIKNNDTVNVKLAREKVHISSIVHSGFVGDDVGYIALTSFTQTSGKDFKEALKSLEQSGKMKSLVVDLRGNTGGSIGAAIDIVGLFVPKGTEVVHARGRVKDFEYSYKTLDNPINTSVPIAVLVNSSSASASEIVAGALQDLDRAVIVGTRTFGKGLMQTVRPIGYNSSIKITTAKYYIPSGRCIQAHNFAERNEDGSVATIPDSLKKEFTTAHGRKVYDGGGIMPDIDTQASEYSNIAISLMLRNLITEYSIQYFAKHESIDAPEKFKITDSDYNDFIEFLSDKEYDYQTQAESLANKLADEIKKGKYDETIQKDIDALKTRIAHDKQKDLQTHKSEISQLLNEEISARYYYQAGRVRSMLTNDEQFDAALQILKNTNKYNSMLSTNK